MNTSPLVKSKTIFYRLISFIPTKILFHNSHKIVVRDFDHWSPEHVIKVPQIFSTKKAKKIVEKNLSNTKGYIFIENKNGDIVGIYSDGNWLDSLQHLNYDDVECSVKKIYRSAAEDLEWAYNEDESISKHKEELIRRSNEQYKEGSLLELQARLQV